MIITYIDINMNTLHSLFNKIYPNYTLKTLQYNIIDNLINGNDVVAILMTGYGKSICYQLPFLYYNYTKSILVICPLISLMQDQQQKLLSKNINTCCFNSNLAYKIKSTIKNNILNNLEHYIIYITPEMIIKESDFISDLIKNDLLALIAIDEAHCISTWGNNFRTDYKELYKLKQWAPNIPIFACTATATTHVKNDIIKSLNLNNPIIIQSTFNRENLQIYCNKKTSFDNDLTYLLQNYKGRSIIYVKTQKDVDLIGSFVSNLGIPISKYHGGLNIEDRTNYYNNFANNDNICMIATIAFGMGIDFNINLIIHYGLPSDLESYYQEIGRAGRDNTIAKCYLYWDKRDIIINKFLLDKDKDTSNNNYINNRIEKFKYIEDYVKITSCRKKYILKYFDEILNDNCLNCDNCFKLQMNDTDKYDMTPIYEPCKLIIETIETFDKMTNKKIVDILRGLKTKNIIKYSNHDLYEKGNKYTSLLLYELITLLHDHNYIKFNDKMILSLVNRNIDSYNFNKRKIFDTCEFMEIKNYIIDINSNTLSIHEMLSFFNNIKN